MSSRVDGRKKASGSSGNGKLLSDLGSINKAYYADKARSRLTSSTASSRSKSVGKFELPEAQMKLEDAKSKKDLFKKDKKSSIWSWKGLKALTNSRSRRFNCCFSLLVHNIKGLPPLFNDVCLIVHWKRRDGELTTRPTRVHQGFAEFEEHLTYSSSVHGSRTGPHHSAKYDAKHFLLYASVYNAPEFDLGKHRIDLTRLLPLSLEELEEEKSSGKWTTSFRLMGKAKGATINVSFGYVVAENSSTEMSGNKNAPHSMRLENSCVQTEVMEPSDITDKTGFCKAGSLPAMSSSSNHSSEDIKDLHEVLPTSRSELFESVNILYKKLSEEISAENKLEDDTLSSQVYTNKGEIFAQQVVDENISQIDSDMTEFSVVDKGIDELTDEKVKSEDKSLDVTQSSEISLEVGNTVKLTLNDYALVHLSSVDVPQNDEQVRPTFSCEEKEKELDSKEAIMKELEAALNSTSDLVDEGFDSRDDETDVSQREDFLEIKSDDGYHGKGKSRSLDDVTDSVANDFLKMLGMEHSPLGFSPESEPESPRERLLRQFAKEVLSDGGLLNFEMDDPVDSTWGTFSEDLDHSSMFECFKENFEVETDAFRSKTRGVKMEDLETEVLIREWGLNEKAFHHSPSSSCGGFGSPVDILSEDPQLLPSLAEGLGPFVRTKDGGFIRSMNPTLFSHAKSGGSLVMQASNPVVVPAEMGSEVIDILQGLAAVGIEKLSMQTNKLMPLEDITGKTIQQIAWESATPSLEGPERRDFVQKESDSMGNIPTGPTTVMGVSRVPKSNKIDSSTCKSDKEYVSLEDLAPLAMDKIEALSMEGLRIQSGMSDEEAPSNITAQSIGEFSALKGNTTRSGGSIRLDGTGGLQPLDIKDNGEDVGGLMNLALTLDEWVKLDSGEIDDDDLISERTSKILVAHHSTSLDQFQGRSRGEKRRSKSRKYGLLGNNFTVALMVQLRDPLRNYEPVGTPMLALIQVERVFVPPKLKLYSTVSLLGDSKEDEEASKSLKTESIFEKPRADMIQEEELIPQYKINEVHVAGLKTDQQQQQQEQEQGKKKLWGSTNQQQSGSRWLLANGMGKKNKHPLMKSKAAQPRDTLWSVSSRGHGKGPKMKELGAQNSLSRNPNVIFPR